MPRKILLPILICLVTLCNLTACVYHPDVQQGNVLTQKDLNALHDGMSAYEVQSLFGDPVLINIFKDNRIVYVYTFQKGHRPMTEKRLLVYLRNNRVVNYWTDSNAPTARIDIPSP